MRSHQFSAKTAARLLGQTPDSPYEFESTEEDEETEDEKTEDEGEEPPHTESDETTSYPSSPSTNHLRSSCSITSSSEDDTPAARKRIKLDPDYVPSEDTTPAVTAASSQVSSESEREEEEDAKGNFGVKKVEAPSKNPERRQTLRVSYPAVPPQKVVRKRKAAMTICEN
jgi:hypothetical protein